MGRPDSNNNPSIGLKIWGPLVPASDCTKCLATLTGVQFAAGVLLWLVPGRRPPPTRSISRNRFIKLSGFLAGGYLIFSAATEAIRLMLPYDPWVEDAARARKQEDALRKPSSKFNFSPSQLRYTWFGPRTYKPVPWPEWRERTVKYLRASEGVRTGVNKLLKAHQSMVAANQSIAEDIVRKIQTKELEVPEPSDKDMQSIDAFADEFESVYAGEELMDMLVIRGDSLWEVFDPEWEAYVNIVPRLTEAFLPGVEIKGTGETKVQSVNYLPIAEQIKR